MKPRTKTILRSVLLLLASMLAGAVLYVYVTLHNSVPQREGSITVEALSHPVEITFDSLGIPQVWAQNEQDALFSMGWLHASDRLFQMELIRRISQGKLSELLGPISLSYDLEARRIGHHRLADSAMATLTEENKKRLQIYADGVNFYVKNCKALPFEFQILGIPFTEWTVKDCLAALSFQTWFSNSLQNRDSWFLELYKTKGAGSVNTISTKYPSWAPPTVPTDSSISFFDIDDQFRHATAQAILPGLTTPSGGSNAWVISPGKSSSGNAILSSDPHLEIGRLPQFWYAVGLHIAADSSGTVGISLPGLPFVVMGHNGKAAFAFTAAGIDVTEYYRETTQAEDSLVYWSGETWRSFSVIPETLFIHGIDSPHVEQVWLTHHGPVIWKDSTTKEIISQRWAGYDADLNQAVSSGFALRTVSKFEDFRRAVTTLGALDANWMYADKQGNIGYQLGTPIPIRPLPNSNAPLNGSDSTCEWRGYWPLEMTPHAYNPPRGWLASCNNIPATNLPYELPGSFAADRILRINHLLDSAVLVSVRDCEKFQMDCHDFSLVRWKNLAADQLRKMGNAALADTVAQWDGATDLESRPTAVIQLFIRHLKLASHASLVGDSLARGVRTIWLEDEIFGENAAPDDSTLLSAMKNAVGDLGNNRWGDINSLAMQHPFAEVPVVSSILELRKGPWPWAGSSGTLNAAFAVPTKDGSFRTIVAPSMRFIVDFAKIDEATLVLPAGESGNPMSDHFFDFFPLWESGRRWNLPFTHEQVIAHSVQTLILTPDSAN